MFSYGLELIILETENVLTKAVQIKLKLCMEPCVSCIYLVYGICVQRATQPARILLTDNKQNGGSCSVNYY